IERSAEIAKSRMPGAGGGASEVTPELRSVTSTRPSSARYPSTAGLGCAYAMDASGGLGETMIRAMAHTSVAIKTANGRQMKPGAEWKMCVWGMWPGRLPVDGCNIANTDLSSILADR